MGTLEESILIYLQESETSIKDLALLVDYLRTTNLGVVKFRINLLKKQANWCIINYVLREYLGLKPNAHQDYVVTSDFLTRLQVELPQLQQVRL